jgi:hypothetical protein
MFFTKRATDATEPDVYVSGEKLHVVSDLKYLGIILDSNLSLKKKACEKGNSEKKGNSNL